jgi:microcystin-dependent protein
MEGTIGEIRGFGGNFAPLYWAYCDGSLIPIAQNTALYSIIGTIYGGDGVATFGLPDLRGRVPVGQGKNTDPGTTDWIIGAMEGNEATEILTMNLLSHTHQATLSGNSITGSATPPCQNDVGSEASPSDNVMAGVNGGYAAPTDADSDMASIPVTINQGGVQVHVYPSGRSELFPVMQPALVINWLICVEGYYPSRN